MRGEELKSLQRPLKEQYRGSPLKAPITLHGEGELGQKVACRVSTGKILIEAGLHPATGGSGLQACPGDIPLQALGACAGWRLRRLQRLMHRATRMRHKVRAAPVSAVVRRQRQKA